MNMAFKKYILDGGMGVGWEGGPRGRGYRYTYS